MKRILSLLLCIIFVLSLSGCRKENQISGSYSERPSHFESGTTEEEESPEFESTPETQPESTPEPAPESVTTPPVNSTPSSVPTPAPQPTPAPPYTLKDYNITVGEYTVNDPENTRGLSTQKFGFGFGVAKNGVAHSISFGNQAKFNQLPNVEALALDTVSTDKRMYLTFDCGYEYKNLTADILDTLKAKQVKAAFFVTLDYLKKNPQLVERMINEGHIVGNHSSTHPVFPDISRTKMAEELLEVDRYLTRHFNYKNKYFRFPTGAYSENALELVTSVGYKSIFWSLAYGDYNTNNQMGYAPALKTVTDRFHSGAVILLHAVSQDNADILAEVIDTAHREGYSFKTLDDYYG